MSATDRRLAEAAALPPPDPVALEHSRRLVQTLRERMDAGPVAFVDYMNAALYEPGLGYYMAGASKFGESGDFVTAPELGPLFGETLAVQCREVFETLAGSVGDETASAAAAFGGEGASAAAAFAAGTEPPVILELGAGTGALAQSLLAALADVPGLRYLILEPSAELAHRQAERLREALSAEAFARVAWLERLPEAFTGVVVANEVVDALPVERFVKTGDAPGACVQVRTVAADPADAADPEASPFEDAFGTAPPELVSALARVEADLPAPLPVGYASELNLHAGPWMRALAHALRRGVVLVVDYGYPRHEYYLPERARGTLACYYRHRVHDDPYRLPGLQDITAHVDFTALVEAGTGAGLELLGYTTQSAFLLGCDLLGLAESRLAALDSEVERLRLSQGVKTLALPGQMGERFQVAAFGRDYDPPLRGFAVLDLAHRL